MNILEFQLEDAYTILLRVNWLALILLFVFLLSVPIFLKFINRVINKRSIEIKEFELGIGNSIAKLAFNKRDQEVAYKLWVELSTRKIGLPFDEDNDVIVQVYDSWYEFFKIARETIKEIPAERIPYSYDLINLTEQVLNVGLRPHLTKWQAKFRVWYEKEAENTNNRAPQEIQKNYPDIDILVDDLKETNKHILEYRELMRKIAFRN